MNRLYILLYLFYSISASAYVISRSETGEYIKWNTSNDKILIYADPRPLGVKSSGISSSDVMSIFSESVSQWNGLAPFDLDIVYTTSLPDYKNTLRFTSDSSYFSSGVLAVTEINYNVETGNIASADILINESFSNVMDFTKDETQSSQLKAFLGDVFTHELGHFLGLSHSEVINSSMIYSVFKNQHIVHEDDKAGVRDLYNQTQSSGKINGKIIGGEGLAVFGVNVLLISVNSGKVIQSQISGIDGTFDFKNVELDDSYYLYTTPLKQKSSLPSYYGTVINTYCSGKTFKSSFYTKCGPRSKSRPQGFYLNSANSSIDVGNITIRCDENIDSNYFALKSETTNRNLELNTWLDDSSHLFTGFFSAQEIAAGVGGLGDEFSLDLRSVDFGSSSPASFLLKLNLISSGLGSGFDFEIKVKRDDQVAYTTYLSTTDETGKIITDQEILLNLSTASNNLFSIKIHPKSLSTSELFEIFSASSSLTNDVAQYVLSAQVGSYSGSEFIPMKQYQAESYDDNTYCTEGEVSFVTQAYTPLTSTSDAGLQKDDSVLAGVSCATIDLDDGPGAGKSGGSFLLGFLLVILLSQFKHLEFKSLSKS